MFFQLHEGVLTSCDPDHWMVAYSIIDLDRSSVDAHCDNDKVLETLKVCGRECNLLPVMKCVPSIFVSRFWEIKSLRGENNICV